MKGLDCEFKIIRSGKKFAADPQFTVNMATCDESPVYLGVEESLVFRSADSLRLLRSISSRDAEMRKQAIDVIARTLDGYVMLLCSGGAKRLKLPPKSYYWLLLITNIFDRTFNYDRIPLRGILSCRESTKIVFSWGTALDSTGGAYVAPPYPLIPPLSTFLHLRCLDSFAFGTHA